jgi:threonine dehydratase
MQENYVDRILKAKVYDIAVETSLDGAPRLSRRLDNRILFKREDLQPVFSFKIRGAYNKIAQLSPITAQRGVICASAGNHAQGVALGARTRGIPAVVVMPLTTPEIKVQAVADLGGEIVCTAMTTIKPTNTRSSLAGSADWCSCIPSTIPM